MVKRKKVNDVTAPVYKLQSQRLTVGIQGPSGKSTYPGTDTTVAEVARYHEFGTSKMPQRPFLRVSMEQHKETIKAAAKKMIKRVIMFGEVDQAQVEYGEAAVKAVRDTIDSAASWAAPLAESTKMRKGHADPLFETGKLKNTVSWAWRKIDLRTKSGQRIVKQGGER